MHTLETGDTYEHDDHGEIRVTEVVQRGGEADIEFVDGEPTVSAISIREARVEFEYTGDRGIAGFGPGTEPLDEFLENIGVDP